MADATKLIRPHHDCSYTSRTGDAGRDTFQMKWNVASRRPSCRSKRQSLHCFCEFTSGMIRSCERETSPESNPWHPRPNKAVHYRLSCSTTAVNRYTDPRKALFTCILEQRGLGVAIVSDYDYPFLLPYVVSRSKREWLGASCLVKFWTGRSYTSQ